MFSKKNKVELSPKLKLGVGRAYSQSQLFKYSGILFLIISAVLVFNAFRLLHNDAKISGTSGTPQVLGDESQAQFIDYKVVQGDTPFNIAEKFNIPWTTLLTLNNLTAGVKLKPGQILKVPKP